MKYILSFIALFTSVNIFAARVDTVEVYSEAMHKKVPCVVIQPDAPKNSTKKFPVVYLLHGYGGDYKNWIRIAPGIKDDADHFQMVIVCPDGGVGSWYFDSPVDPAFKYDTFVSKELVAYTDQHYSTMPDRAHRAIAGLSMGGHGAFYLALKHKDVYGAISSISGGVDFRPFPNNWDLKKRLGTMEQNPESWQNHTVINMADSLKNKEFAISFDCGVNDFFINVNRALNAKLIKLNIEHDYTERPGAHTVAYWKNSITYTLLFFHKYFSD